MLTACAGVVDDADDVVIATTIIFWNISVIINSLFE